MEHTEDCIEEEKHAQEEHEAWVKKWPNYCRACNAEGGKVIYGTRNFVDSSGGDDSFDPCPNCQNREIPVCPRCAVDWQDDEIWEECKPCPSCGWNWGTGRDDYCPPTREGVMTYCECAMENFDIDDHRPLGGVLRER